MSSAADASSYRYNRSRARPSMPTYCSARRRDLPIASPSVVPATDASLDVGWCTCAGRIVHNIDTLTPYGRAPGWLCTLGGLSLWPALETGRGLADTRTARAIARHAGNPSNEVGS